MISVFMIRRKTFPPPKKRKKLKDMDSSGDQKSFCPSVQRHRLVNLFIFASFSQLHFSVKKMHSGLALLRISSVSLYSFGNPLKSLAI